MSIDRNGGSITVLVLVGFLIGVSVGLICGQATTGKNVIADAVINGTAEYYLDLNGKSQWRWVTCDHAATKGDES